MNELAAERDRAINDKLSALRHQSSDIKVAVRTAVQSAVRKEREHFAKRVNSVKEKNDTLSSKVTCLRNRAVDAEIEKKNAERQVSFSTRRSESVSLYTASLEERVKELEAELTNQRNLMIDTQEELDITRASLQEAIDAHPIKEIRRYREGQRGQPVWPLFMWELIIEQLVAGTPPSSVNGNIITFVKTICPSINIVELPSIWTIRRARTVIMVMVQTLAAYRIAKADRWMQLFTDGTSRRQIAMQDLIISIEEDDLFK